MVKMTPPVCDFGWKAPDFDLPGVDGKSHKLSTLAGPRGTLVAFICNHCPYVKATLDAFIRDARGLKEYGVSTVAVMSNDPAAYEADSFENMKKIAADMDFPFPYLFDETQSVGRAYGAVCTPDFFGFNGNLELQYRGRIAAHDKLQIAPAAKRDLFDAMKQVAETGRGPEEQVPSMGCSIKWRQ